MQAVSTTSPAPGFTSVRGPIYPWPIIIAQLTDCSIKQSQHRFIVYRHAETEFNAENLITGQTDVDLTYSGRDAARNLQRILPVNFDGVYCSALRRAIDTGRLALMLHPNVQMRVDARLNEVRLGSLEGQRRRYIPAFAHGDIDFAPPGGESYRAAAQRMFSAVADIAAYAQRYHHASTDLVFAHAGVMRIVATLVMRITNPAQIFELKFPKNFGLEIPVSLVDVPRFWYPR